MFPKRFNSLIVSQNLSTEETAHSNLKCSIQLILGPVGIYLLPKSPCMDRQFHLLLVDRPHMNRQSRLLLQTVRIECTSSHSTSGKGPRDASESIPWKSAIEASVNLFTE